LNSTTAAEWIRTEKIIAILRGDFSIEKMEQIASILLEGGINTLEITLNSSAALEGIARLRQSFASRMLIGAGTVRTAGQVRQAVQAGAQFLIAPNFDPASAAQAGGLGVLHIPGVLTPSEAQSAFAAGCRLLKLFPADTLGPAYLKALRAPLNDIDFIPTGGIGTANAAEYLRAGAAALGIGSSLVSGPEQSPSELAARAANLRAAICDL